MKIAVIGGGAAGFFSAISCKEHHPKSHVTIYEKTQKVLSKVKVSGGGRCNVTHNCTYPSELAKHYPRGGKQLKKAFKIFNNHHTKDWFEKYGVLLKVEEDGRMFPTTDDSQTIIDCLIRRCKELNIDIRLKAPIDGISKEATGYLLTNKKGFKESVNNIIICSGGSNKSDSYDWLKKLGHKIIKPVPSLFTFNMPSETVKSLMGVVVPRASVSIVGTKYKSIGPVLITHWGMSGPGILVLSSWAARDLYQSDYKFEVAINWTDCEKEEELKNCFSLDSKKQLKNDNPFDIPNRFWMYLISKSTCNPETTWQQQPKKAKNKLLKSLYYDVYQVKGKTTFKEEFVTCGGVALESVNMNTMESRYASGIYFAGEVLDIDAVTGGFNFQGAWTTGHIAGKLN